MVIKEGSGYVVKCPEVQGEEDGIGDVIVVQEGEWERNEWMPTLKFGPGEMGFSTKQDSNPFSLNVGAVLAIYSASNTLRHS